MRPIAPRIEGADEIDVAEDQHDYMQVVAAIVPKEREDALLVGDLRTDTRVVQWTFSDEERQAIAAGADMYFATLANMPMMPHHLRVGWP